MGEKRRKLMVTGAGGRLGRRVVELLLEQSKMVSGAESAERDHVIAGSRRPETLESVANAGASLRRLDLDDPSSLASAFADVDRLLLVSTNAMGEDRRRQHLAAIEAAKTAGVKHVVYTSMPRPEPGCLVPFAPDHWTTEQALVESGLGFTVLRNAWYADNLLDALPGVVASGKWFTSAGDGRVANVTREDCARAAAAALSAPTASSERFDVTGPAALTTAQLASLAAEILAIDLEVVHLSDDDLAAHLVSVGVPPAFVSVIVGSEANTRAGNFDLVSDGVERLTGRAPESLRSFLARHAAALRSAR